MPDYVYIDSTAIAANMLRNDNRPPICVSTGKPNTNPRVAFDIRINAPCRVIYSKAGVLGKDSARVMIVAPDGSVEIVR